MRKRFWIILLLVCLSGLTLQAQTTSGPPSLDPDAVYRVRTIHFAEYELDEHGDTIPHFYMTPIYCFKEPIDREKYWRLIRNVKLVYPIARYANDKLREMERVLATMEGDRRAQERYTKQIERELKEQYTPIIKRMSFSQGKVLIKLIDRETGQTSYQLVKDMRGNFSAFFWQNLGRIFGMNLKDTYDPDGDDRIIEQVICLYEAGIL